MCDYDGHELSPWSTHYIGIPVNFFSVGLICAGSVSVLYPILIVQQGDTSTDQYLVLGRRKSGDDVLELQDLVWGC